MCGINFILDKQLRLTDNRAIQAMNQATGHRGPEASEVLHFTNPSYQLFLGHNRLKILDLSEKAAQPMSSPDGRYTLIYNGEIYNHASLRQQLKDKFTFRSHSDTEVLLYWLIAYQSDWSAALATLRGMYAFIYLDQQQQQILIGRDALGIKPLYYYEDARYLIFSSETKGILASGLVSKQLEARQIAPYLCFRFARSPATFYQGIQEWQGNAVLHLSSAAVCEQSDIIPILDHQVVSADTNFSLSILEQKLKDSLTQQLMADVPLGLFLSGGVDSTLLLALARELGFERMPCFTITQAASEQNYGTADARYARLAAKQFGGILHELEVEAHQLQDLDYFIAQIDQPVADSAAWLTYLLAQTASKQVKVLLSGAGADELWAGYHRHQAFAFYLQNAKLLGKMAPIAKQLLGFFSDRKAGWGRKQLRLLKKFFQQIDKHPKQTFLRFTQLEWNQFLTILSSDLNEHFSLSEALRYDQTHYLKDDVLKISDQMTMRHSLELRVPYLDPSLVAYAHGFSGELLLKQGKKWPLKQILAKKGGKIFTQRPKEGFGVPLGHWLRQSPTSSLLQEMLEPHHLIYEYIDLKIVKYVCTQHLSGQQDFSSEIWAFLILQKWLEQEFA